MTFERLPNEEPGKPLIQPSPGFADRLMDRIAEHRREERRRRRRRISAAIVLSSVCLGASAYLLSTKQADYGRPPENVQTQPRAAAQTQPPTAVQTQPRSAAQPQPARAATKAATVLAKKTVTSPEDVVIIVNGRELHGAELEAAKATMGLGKCVPPEIELIRDGKPVRQTPQTPGGSKDPCVAARHERQ